MKRGNPMILILGVSSMMFSNPSYADLGAFEAAGDVGRVSLPGSAHYDAGTGQYRITGSGANMWGSEDAFHLVWRKVSGDLKLSARVTFEGSGGDPHRKAGWMVRKSLKADAAYVDAIVHGDGLTSLQYRMHAGGDTAEVQSPVKAPQAVLLERDGDLFTFSVAGADGAFQSVGSMLVPLGDPVYVGLAVCSHDATRKETASTTSTRLACRAGPRGGSPPRPGWTMGLNTRPTASTSISTPCGRD